MSLDAVEAALLEAELGESPDGQRALAEIRAAAEQLRAALAAEPVPTITSETRAAILDAAANSTPVFEPAPAGVNAHAPQPLRPAMTNPASPAIRRVSWLRRHRTAVASLRFIAFRCGPAGAGRAAGPRGSDVAGGSKGRARSNGAAARNDVLIELYGQQGGRRESGRRR